MIELATPDLGPLDRLRPVKGLRVFPVRHHSPQAARVLCETVRARPPRAVLLEGPSDADPFLPVIADASSRPPLALLAFRDGEQRAFSQLPYAEFSPEYQAIALARELGVPIRFFDLPCVYHGDREKLVKPEKEAPGEARPFESAGFWEDEFESRRLAPEAYVEAALLLGRELRGLRGEDAWTLVREAYMMARAHQLVADGLDPADILVVCGAAHAGPLIDASTDFEMLKRLSPPQRAQAFLVPYSYAQLSMASGYASGLPYPGFAQAVWQADGDVEGAVCRVLTDVAAQLTRQGFSPSLADAIDGLALAKNLSALRGRAAPGVGELVQAVEACLTRGTYARAADAVRKSLIGDAVGALAAEAGRSPLAIEFYAFVTHDRYSPPLLVSDRPMTRTLDLHAEAHREVSTFLHRCELAGIPYARATAESGSWQETWRLAWTPELDMRLAEACEEGLTIEEVAQGQARKLLAASETVSAAAAVYVDTVRAGLTGLVDEVRRAVEARCVTTDDAPALCAAVAQLYILVRYEGLPPALAAPIRALFESVVGRALLVVGALTGIADDEAQKIAGGLSRMVDVRPALAPAQQALLDSVLIEMMESRDAHPLLAGTATGLALLLGKVAMPRVAAEVEGRLCGAGTEVPAMHYLDGLFSNQRRELVATRDLVRALRAFVERLSAEDFVRLLPALRRTFGKLAPAELAVLFSNLVRCRPAAGEAPRAGGPRRARVDRVMTRALAAVTRRLRGEVRP